MGVIQMCWIVPEPLISATVSVASAATHTKGEPFHPLSSSRTDYRMPAGKPRMVSSFQKETGAAKEPPCAKI